MIAVLNGSTESLAVVLAGAKTSLDCPYRASWVGDGGPKDAMGTTNGTTVVTVLSGADGAPPRQIRGLTLFNKDTGAVTVTVSKVVGATTYNLAKVTLQVGDRLRMTEDGIVQVTDSNGQSKAISTANLNNMSLGASTAAAGTTTSDAGVLPAGTAQVYSTTAADGTKGVRINASDNVTGRLLFIGNQVSNAILKVYPPSGGTINGAAADAAFSSVSGKGVIAYCRDAATSAWLAW